jgi:hypothetical protein
MPIPFIFPIAGFVMTGTGLAMVVRYVQADAANRSKLDTWLTDAIKATFKAYVRMRYGINLGSLTAAEEKEYWREFGLRLQAFLALAEPITIEMYAVAGSSSTSLGSSRLSAAPISAEATVAVANIGGNGVPYAFQVSHAVPDQPGQYSAAQEKDPEKGHCITHAN